MSLILLYHSHPHICPVLDPPAVLSCPTMHYLRSNPFHTIPIRFKQLSFLPSCSTELPLPPCSELSNHVSTSTQPRPCEPNSAFLSPAWYPPSSSIYRMRHDPSPSTVPDQHHSPILLLSFPFLQKNQLPFPIHFLTSLPSHSGTRQRQHRPAQK